MNYLQLTADQHFADEIDEDAILFSSGPNAFTEGMILDSAGQPHEPTRALVIPPYPTPYVNRNTGTWRNTMHTIWVEPGLGQHKFIHYLTGKWVDFKALSKLPGWFYMANRLLLLL